MSLFAVAGAVASVAMAGPETVSGEIHQRPKAELKAPSTMPLNSSQLVVRLDKGADINDTISKIASQYPGLRFVQTISADLDFYLVDAGSTEDAKSVRDALMGLPNVSSVRLDQPRDTERVLRQVRALMQDRDFDRPVPPPPSQETWLGKTPISLDPNAPRGGGSTDPFFSLQWHFDQGSGSSGFDNNIPSTVYTARGLSGTGVTVGFSNLGRNSHIDTDHIELDDRFRLSLTSTFDPNLFGDSTALTSLAGLVSAEVNGIGVQGVAPGAGFALYDWPAGAGVLPLQEYNAFQDNINALQIKVFDMGSSFYDIAHAEYNLGALTEYVGVGLRNSYNFGRGRKGVVNIFSTGMNAFGTFDVFFAGSPPFPKWPDPYNFPPGGSTWSPLDELNNAGGNSVAITLTNGYVTGPYYVNAQTNNYAPATDYRSLVFQTVADDGFADIYAGQGTNVFASFYGATTNPFQAALAGQPAPTQLLSTIPGPGGAAGQFPPAVNTLPAGYETMSGAMIGAGVIALMLESNPSLSIRDIQHILFESIQESSKDDNVRWPNFSTGRSYIGGAGLGDSFWQVNAGFYNSDTITNQAIRHSDIYGFGVVDSDLAIAKAANWQGTSPLVRLDTGYVGSFNDPDIDTDDEISIVVPDATFLDTPIIEPDGEIGLDGLTSFIINGSGTLPTLCVRQNYQIESVVLELTVEGSGNNDLYITITSPHGTQSVVKLPTTTNVTGTTFDTVFTDDDADAAGEVIIGGTEYALYRHRFLSWKHWGELSAGEWTVSVTDYGPDTINPEGEDPGTGPMGDPGADMVIALGNFGVPGSEFRDEKTITGYRFQIFGTDTGLPIFPGCPPTQTTCPGDLNGDGRINVEDLQIFVNWYYAGNNLADLDGDGAITYLDLIIFRGLWQPGFCNQNGGTPRPGDSNVGDNNPPTRPI